MIPKKVAPRGGKDTRTFTDGTDARLFSDTDFGSPLHSAAPPASVNRLATPRTDVLRPPASQGTGLVNGQVVTQIWIALSRFPKEGSLAGLRFKQMAHLGLDEQELLWAISEHAVEGHHAAALTAEKCRSRIARMHEVFRAEEKRIESTVSAKVDVVIGGTHYRMDRLAMRRTGMTKIADAVSRTLAMLKREEG